jgi:RHS repeat-associated protein
MPQGQGHIANTTFAPKGAWQSDVSASEKCLGYDAFGSLLPGRNYSSDSYRYAWNGQEKDDEMHGATGTSYAYEARMYDPRIGRWLSLDPNAKKYPGISPYNFSYNNPVIFNDPDGRDGRLKIQRNASGGGTITLESTVFLYGPDASAEMAQKAQDDFDRMSTGYEYKDAEGQTWCVQINVTYVYQQSLSAMAEAMGQPKDESLSRYDLTGEQMESIGYQEGDNFMLLDRSLDQKVNGTPVGDISDHGGSSSTVSWVRDRVINHSAMHELGFDDYYPSAYFQGDLMGRLGTKIGDIHYINIAEKALSEEPTPMGQFELKTKGFMSVKSDPFDRNQPSLRDKENHAKQKISEQAERKGP